MAKEQINKSNILESKPQIRIFNIPQIYNLMSCDLDTSRYALSMTDSWIASG